MFQLPTYSPDLHPREGIWSLVKRDLGNLTAADLSQTTRAVKHRLKQIQYRTELADGCLARTTHPGRLSGAGCEGPHK
ncbi:hypothetical protein [Streptomyces sp. NPDC059224]|uniref:hypothetical protein n=1 Tax=Streptomyces sp. NPDC059224 TaxID=3346775 RepID=UPI0036CA99FC